MPVNKSRHAYRNERLNCAQSILRGFQELHDITEEQIVEAKHLGGGKADGGLCGALHAASILVTDEEKRVELHQRFTAQAGSDRCREIRALKQLTCGECVELAASILHNG